LARPHRKFWNLSGSPELSCLQARDLALGTPHWLVIEWGFPLYEGHNLPRIPKLGGEVIFQIRGQVWDSSHPPAWVCPPAWWGDPAELKSFHGRWPFVGRQRALWTSSAHKYHFITPKELLLCDLTCPSPEAQEVEQGLVYHVDFLCRKVPCGPERWRAFWGYPIQLSKCRHCVNGMSVLTRTATLYPLDQILSRCGQVPRGSVQSEGWACSQVRSMNLWVYGGPPDGGAEGLESHSR
jgi:hypothetical protein